MEMHGVNVSCGRHEVLREFNWAVKLGERWLVTGPNGSGKSTLAALIVGGHLQACSNDIRIFGKRRCQGDSIWTIKKTRWLDVTRTAVCDRHHADRLGNSNVQPALFLF